MTDSMTRIHATQASFLSNHNCFQAFTQHGAIRRGAFCHGAHGVARLRQHPALANPAELRALLPRVHHRTWAGSRETFQENRQCLGPQAEGLRGRLRRFLRVAQTWQTAPYHSKTQRKKTRHETRHLTPRHSPQTLTAPQHRQHVVKPCCSVTRHRSKNFGAPQPQNGQRSPKNLENGLLASFFYDPSTDGRKHSAKMRLIEI